MSIASRIDAIEQHLEDDYSVLEVAGADLTNVDKNIINLKSTWQERLLYFINNGIEEVYNNWDKVTGEGTEISLNNTLEAKMGIIYKGNTYQYSTTGKNLFNKSLDKFISSNTSRTELDTGVRAIATRAGGTGVHYYFSVVINNSDDLLGKTVNISSTITPSASNQGKIKLYWRKESSMGTQIGTNALTSTGNVNIEVPSSYPDNMVGIVIVFYSNEGGTANIDDYVDYTNVQLEIGDTATPYEPYTNGTSPNPDYPQDIQTVSGDNTIIVSNSDNTQSASYPINLPEGMELCKIGDYQDRIAKSTGNNLIPTQASAWEQGTISGTTGQNSSSTTRIRTIDYYPIKNDIDYHISMKNTDYRFLNILLYDDEKEFINQLYYINAAILNAYDLTINIPSSRAPNVAYMRVTVKKSDDSTVTADEVESAMPMLNEGSAALPYEPYGKVWYLNKQIGRVVLDGSENYLVSGNCFACTSISDYSRTSNTPYSNYYKGVSNVTTASDLSNNEIGFNNNANYNRLYILNTSLGNVDALKTWLSTHNTTVYYVLATPTYTEITDSTLLGQLEALKTSYEGQTNISQENNDLASVLNASALQEM